MTENLPILSPSRGFGNSSIARRADREISKANAKGSVLAARENAKIEAIADVTESALVATSHVSAVEALLISRTPHAEARLRHLADAGCAGMASVVMRMGRSCH